MPDLNNAVQLIRQGQNTEAQQLLQTIIKAEPKNIQAWFLVCGNLHHHRKTYSNIGNVLENESR